MFDCNFEKRFNDQSINQIPYQNVMLHVKYYSLVRKQIGARSLVELAQLCLTKDVRFVAELTNRVLM